MGRAKGITADEKATIIREFAKGTNAKDIAHSLGRHVDTVERFIANPTPRKKRSNSGGLKAKTTRELRLIKRKLHKKPGQTILQKQIYQKFQNQQDFGY